MPQLFVGGTLEVRMDQQFLEQWTRLSASGRIVLCHRMAEEAEGSAELAGPQFREDFKRIAGGWLELAAELEAAH